MSGAVNFSERAVEAAATELETALHEHADTPEGSRNIAKRILTAALAVDGLALQGWRTIDSAPKDGTEVLLWFPFTPDKPHWSHPAGFVFLAKWWISDGIDEDRWVDPDDCEDLGSTPTHWQPLPAPPLTAASGGEVG